VTKFKCLPLILAFIFALTQLPAQTPLRAGIDVPEPKLIQKVDIDYPDLIKHWFIGNAPVVLDILINEQGLVTKMEERSFDASVLETVKAAVKQWRFAPTIVKGKAVPVTATIVTVFSLGYNPYPIDLGIRAIILKIPPGNWCVFPATITHDGQLREAQRSLTARDAVSENVKSMSLKEQCGEQSIKQYALIPESDASFSIIESKMQSPEPHTLYRLASSRYYFPINHPTIEHSMPGIVRLYYSTLLTSNVSQLIQLAGIDPDVQPPKLNVDFDRLAGFLKDSRHKEGAIYFFTVLVDETGKVLGVEYSDTRNEAVIEALSKATVLAPGTRNGKPVPTAVIIAISVK
jgi:hypothetical protein